MKKINTLFVVTLTILLGTSVGLVGCKKATGGGQVTGSAGGGKINLGFQMRCEDIGESGQITGQFQYKDRGAGVAFHAVVDQSALAIFGQGASCEAVGGIFAGVTGAFAAAGTYTPQPKNIGEGGDIVILVQDETNLFNLACTTGQDAVIVQLNGGVHNGYSEGACLDRGNITVFEE